MHRSYHPLQPVTNRYLKQQWDQKNYENHRWKVSTALPAVDTKGCRTYTHVMLKPKKLQLQEERMSVIDRDNRLLASKLASIVHSKGLVDHRNQYQPRSLNAQKRNHELLLIGQQNHGIYQRITARQSEYRRRVWLNEWEKSERRLDNISRFPKRLEEKHRFQRKVKFSSEDSDDDSSNRETCGVSNRRQ
ncbi:uncharacterized protein CFAP97D2 [Gouania willdenowi]|uniref:uncharacterized protein CFAP97D2 n=1 Tax=Gouania willdenowi TaxID=441366 RepID=UPI00105578DB|nr:uncharacterized protein CFAP97D2 [Gouania willdenowi]